ITFRQQSSRRYIGQQRMLLPLSRSWFKGTLLEAGWPYRGGQVKQSLIVGPGIKPDICVFHAKPNADSTANRARIPQQSERRFHGKPSRDSTTARARIPCVTEQ
ncbi:hypothetical protein AB4Y32_40160, partial [Paraburkholderia phymatum]